MARKLRPADADTLSHLRNAKWMLMRARTHLRKANSPKTLARVRKALTSIGGAIRHAEHRVQS